MTRLESRRDKRQAHRSFMEQVGDDLAGLGLVDASTRLKGEMPIAEVRRRRGSRRGIDSGVGLLTLMEVDGVLRWVQGPVSLGPAGGRRRGRRAGRRAGAGPEGSVVTQLKFAQLPPNQVGRKLEELDAKLTPNQGLHAVTKQHNVGKAIAKPVQKGRILLFVHGTFSSCENVLSEIEETSEGKKMLTNALSSKSPYDQVLAFNHPTLGVSPILNALELARAFEGSAARVDIVCHSRGGLVSRWWVEEVASDERKASKIVFVGSPLAGTSLASPHRLKEAMEWIANLSNALYKVSAGAAPLAGPLFTASAVLMKLLSCVTNAITKTPMLDAAVAMVPGLAAQAREGANKELRHLRGGPSGAAGRYFAIQADFEPEPAGWRIWKFVTQAKSRLADKGADIVFPGKNDLVVDTRSMTSLADEAWIADKDRYDFGTQASVYHTNYFRQPETIAFCRKKLGF